MHHRTLFEESRWTALAACLIAALVALVWLGPLATIRLSGQEPSAARLEEVSSAPELEGMSSAAADGAGAAQPDQSASEQPKKLSLLWLLVMGGPLMIPIVLMSVLVVAVVIERFLSLRKAKVMPRGLIQELGAASGTSQGFDPRQAYRICQQYPSSASTVIRAMLLKVGRPHSEVEHAVAEASEREASRLYGNVRWLNLATGVCPLLGLFGTVWGMIRCFFDTTQLQAGQNKAQFLAEGIYVALVTTLGGLAVAIPAAILAHYFEGRIQGLFHQIDELLFNLLPQVERYEGRLRVSRQSLGDADHIGIGAVPDGPHTSKAPPTSRAAPK